MIRSIYPVVVTNMRGCTNSESRIVFKLCTGCRSGFTCRDSGLPHLKAVLCLNFALDVDLASLAEIVDFPTYAILPLPITGYVVLCCHFVILV